MANSKISALTSATTIAGTEVLPIVQSSATVKVSVANLTPGLDTITAAKGGTGQTSYAVGDLLYANTTTSLAKLADVATGNALISGGVSTAPSWGKIGLTTHISGTLPVANGGTNASSASITAFNNITGYSASGATGTTSTNLVFSTSPTITTPTFNTTDTQVTTLQGIQNFISTSKGFEKTGISSIASITAGTLTKVASVTIASNTLCGQIIFEVDVTNNDANFGYSVARSQRVVLFSKYGGVTNIINQSEQHSQQGSINSGVINVTLTTTAAVNGADIDLKCTPSATGAVGATVITAVTKVVAMSANVNTTLTMV